MKKLAIKLVLIVIVAVVYSCNRDGGTQDCPDRTLYNNNVCPKDTVWVCGCNDSSYINECVATKRGYYVVSQGKCQ